MRTMCCFFLVDLPWSLGLWPIVTIVILWRAHHKRIPYGIPPLTVLYEIVWTSFWYNFGICNEGCPGWYGGQSRGGRKLWCRISRRLPIWVWLVLVRYNDVIMSAMASQITSLMIVYSIVYSSADQRVQQSPASLAFVRWIPRTNGQYRGKCFHLMTSSGNGMRGR